MFFVVGGMSFSKKGEIIGDDDAFYMNYVRYYIPIIELTAYGNCHLEIGIFTMQSCGLRNKEANHAYSRHSNGKGNVHTQVLKRLYDMVNR